MIIKEIFFFLDFDLKIFFSLFQIEELFVTA